MAFELSSQSRSPSPINYDRGDTPLAVITLPGTIVVPEVSDDEFVLDSIKHPLSPRSAFNILAKHGENLSPATTLALAQATAKSAIERNEAYELRLRLIQQQQNKATIASDAALATSREALQLLQERLDQYARDSDDGVECPRGFEENRGRIPNFFILVDGIRMQARYIKRQDDTTILGTAGRSDDPIFAYELKAQAMLTADDYENEDVVPIPNWFLPLIRASSPVFPLVIQRANQLQDWGLNAELHRYHNLDTRLQEITRQRQVLEAEEESIRTQGQYCRLRLEAARAPQRLADLEALDAPHMRFNPYEPDNERPHFKKQRRTYGARGRASG
jgi:hypothetical protein